MDAGLRITFLHRLHYSFNKHFLEENMKKNYLVVCFTAVLIFLGVTSVFAQQVPKAPNAIKNTLRGMNIVVGNCCIF